MTRVTNTKIEMRALNTIEDVIDNHPTMSYNFNSLDKEMSWDGYIYIYNSDEEQNKEVYDDRIPVQIKGHVDEAGEYIHKERISYKVELADLNVYFGERGVIYFQVFMSENGSEREIFYNLLYPSKIKGYLDEAKRKKNKTAKNIVFTRLKRTPSELYRIAKQFSNESGYQGSGRNPLVMDMIPINNVEKLTSITATALGARNEYELFRLLSSGDVCFYGEMEGNPYKIPIEWRDDTKFFMKKVVKAPIKLGEEEIYDTYKIDADSDDNITMHFSDNLSMDSLKRQFSFKPVSTIREIIKDAKFLYGVVKLQGFYIGDQFLSCPGICLSQNMDNILQLFFDIDKALLNVGLDVKERVDSIENGIMNELLTLVNMMRGHYNNRLEEKLTIFNWNYNGHIVPVLVNRHDNDDENDISNAAYSSKLVCYLEDENKEHYRVPSFGCIEDTVILNLYKYDFDAIRLQIEQEDVNYCTIDNLNNLSLRLIQIYDKFGYKKALELATVQQEKISVFAQEAYYLLNIAQIRIRLDESIEDIRKKLRDVSDGTPQVDCGIWTVLGDSDKAKNYYELMSKEEKETFEEWPMSLIYHKLVG